MGTVTKRIVLLVALVGLLAPAAAQADTSWYRPGDYAVGPTGGSDNATSVTADTATGELRALQFQFTAVSGNLGCNGQGPFANFDVAHTSEDPVNAVLVEFSQAVISPYAFAKVSLLQDGVYLQTTNLRGPVLGDGVITLDLDAPVSGDMVARVGIEVSSNCPSVDGGRAIIAGVGFNS